MSDSSKNRFGPVPTLRTGQSHPHPEPIAGEPYSAVELMPGYRVVMLDQRKLPQAERYEFFSRVGEVADAIRTMTVRGAPAIGIAAAYGMVCAGITKADAAGFLEAMRAADVMLRATRPTAVNLAWATMRMLRVAEEIASLEPIARNERLARAAREIHLAEVVACKAIGTLGAELLPDVGTVLTHCNAGALATGGYGTALGVIRAARAAGKNIKVLACETRPLLQGARLTAWELQKEKIPVEVITDSMAAHFMAKKAIDAVIVGADRIAKNGDVANKIGTYTHACVASAHGVPFYVAAPRSTIDMACPNGDAIPIEERDEREVTYFGDRAVAPQGVRARNPAFDVTPARLVAALITERGVVRPPSEAELTRLARD